MTYSSARFAAPDEGLEVAQTRKYAALARLMDLKPGQTVLEIGCGWGASPNMRPARSGPGSPG